MTREENQQQTQLTYDTTLVGDDFSHHCAIPAPTEIKGVLKIARNCNKINS